MVVDIGEVKKHIKPKADSTLRNMRKDDLIEYIRCLEHNYNVGATFLENQARYIESLDVAEVVHGRWIDGFFKNTFECSVCFEKDVHYCYNSKSNYCPLCGAKMDGKEEP